MRSQNTFYEIGKNLMLGLADGIQDSTSAAVSAAEGASKKISEVDFSPKEFSIDSPVDYDALMASASNVVRSTQQNTGGSVTGGYYGGYDLTKRIDKLQECLETISEKIKIPETIDTTLNIDGRLFSRELTPYIEKELAWNWDM